MWINTHYYYRKKKIHTFLITTVSLRNKDVYSNPVITQNDDKAKA